MLEATMITNYTYMVAVYISSCCSFGLGNFIPTDKSRGLLYVVRAGSLEKSQISYQKFKGNILVILCCYFDAPTLPLLTAAEVLQDLPCRRDWAVRLMACGLETGNTVDPLHSYPCGLILYYLLGCMIARVFSFCDS
ncbi:hypothetical protein NMG60_11022725 [Bertholletia excelsa]